MLFPQFGSEFCEPLVVFVVARDHSRRIRRVLDRVMKGNPTRVIVQLARYSSFDPNRWWETRGGIRTEIVELEKLVLDVILHVLLAGSPG